MCGVFVRDTSTAQIDECQCNENGWSGVECTDSSAPVIVKSVCEKNKYGVCVRDTSTARIDECQCNENRESGVATYHESSATVTTSSCCRNGSAGLSQFGGRITHTGCTLEGNKKGSSRNC